MMFFMATVTVPQRMMSMPALADEVLSAVTHRGSVPTRRTLAKGDFISLQDGRSAAVHFLAKGRVKVLRFSDEGRVILLALFEAGELFGEMSFPPLCGRPSLPVAELRRGARAHRGPLDPATHF